MKKKSIIFFPMEGVESTNAIFSFFGIFPNIVFPQWIEKFRINTRVK
jgi:hypothetical protein